jgi:hypothetical protein
MEDAFKHLMSPIRVVRCNLLQPVLVTVPTYRAWEQNGIPNEAFIAYHALGEGGAALQISGASLSTGTGSVGVGRGLDL